MSFAILNDLTKCIGCRACVLACEEINGLPASNAGDKLSATAWTAVEQRAGLNVRRQCMHCLEPACVSVCPVAALRKTDAGPVVYDESRCIGCRYCMVGCPFGIPKYEWDKALPRVRKCILCFEKRVAQGLRPACTEACPTGATIFGERDDLIRVARDRVRAHPELYVDHIYGLREVGGTSVLYLSSVPFEELGFATGLKSDPYPALTWEVLSKLPNVVGVGGLVLLGIWWISNRRETLKKVEVGEITLEEAMIESPPLAEKQRGRDDKERGDEGRRR